jgi:hypothetical protein
MGGVCSTYGDRNLRKRDPSKDPGVEGRIILKCMFRKYDKG